MSRCENGYACWTTSGHLKCLMLVLLSLVRLDVRLGATHSWRSAVTGHSSESAGAVLLAQRSFKLPTEPRQRHPESASGGSAFWRKS